MLNHRRLKYYNCSLTLQLLITLLASGILCQTVEDCEGINSYLIVNRACRCFDSGVSHPSFPDNPGVWIGCTHGKMPEIQTAFGSFPNDTTVSLEKLWLWNDVVPFIPSDFFANLAPKSLIIETSRVSVFDANIFSPIQGAALENLKIRNNDVSVLDPSLFLDLSNLKTIDFSGNLIRRVESAPDVKMMEHLEDISFYQNRIEQIDPKAFSFATNARTLNLARNQLTKLTRNTLAGLENLQILNLEFNSITEISEDCFDNFKDLEILNLANNRISSLTLRNLPKLRKLHLNNNSFVDFGDLKLGEGLGALRILYLDQNKIKSIPDGTFKGLTSLSIISAAGNDISQVDPDSFVGLTNLKTLSLQQNRISVIPPDAFTPLKSLEKLFLSHNLLESVSESGFEGLQGLRALSLAHNQLHHFHPDALANMLNLEKLFLNGNKLKSFRNVSLEADKNTKLILLDVSGNPFMCDCENLEILRWMKINADIVLNMETTECEGLGSILKTLVRLEDHCHGGIGSLESRRRTSTWITVLGISLGILSIMIITGVVVLFMKDQDSQGARGRTASDMQTLLPNPMKPNGVIQGPGAAGDIRHRNA